MFEIAGQLTGCCMMSPVPFWSKIPFFRLLLPLVAGISLQWYHALSLTAINCLLLGSLLTFLITQFFSLPVLFKYGWITGVMINVVFIAAGAFLTYQKNIRNRESWFGHSYKDSAIIIATIVEPLAEKENSFKANAEVVNVVCNNRLSATSGKIILYFKNESSIKSLQYGSVVVISKALGEIRNNGNPGAFDYKRYCLFNGITHQLYLTERDYLLIEGRAKVLGLDGFLYSAREKTISVLRKFITSKKELGLAEALLIGYKDDLDKALVQSYTNTGAVHIIAISGQHLALIYWLLLQVLSPLKKTRYLKWLNTIIIISVLWLFSLMTGAQPSIIRAALMCTIILLAEVLSRKSNTLNSLACSAFVLLCINPFNLWDVGCQLSFAGLLSLVVFTRPVYNLLYVDNPIPRHVWQLIAATVAAQILTTPVSIYHFHQFPFSFLLTNLLAVPLSGLILIGELLLFVLSVVPVVALLAGKLLTLFIWLMNIWVERIEGLSGMLWDGLQISFVQMVLLDVAILGFSVWLLNEVKPFIWVGIGGMVFFLVIRSYSFYISRQQKLFIVYNVSKHSAIDIVDGRRFYFIGDGEVNAEGFLRNFNITPARTLLRKASVEQMNNEPGPIELNWSRNRILVDEDVKEVADVLVVSKQSDLRSIEWNPSLVKQVVLDGSIPQWKIKQWVEKLKALNIPCHNVSVDGAFVFEIK